MKKVAFLLAILAFVLSSCHVYEEGFSFKESSGRYLQPSISGYITPTVADLNVSPTKISHVEIFDNDIKDESLATSSQLEYMKNYTLARAVQQNNADVLVGPLFDVETIMDGDRIKITVTGYPATYVNFRKVNEEDLKLLDDASQKLKVATPGDRSEMAESQEVTSSQTAKEMKKDNRIPVPRKWQHAANISFGALYGGKDLGARYEAGFRFNKVILLGLGLGYNYNFEFNAHRIPVFAHMKLYFRGEKKVNPFIAISEGIDVTVVPGMFGIGNFFRSEFGLNIRLKDKNLPISFELGCSPDLVKGASGLAHVEHYFYYGCKVGFSF